MEILNNQQINIGSNLIVDAGARQYFKRKAYLSINYERQDFLFGKKLMRWKLRCPNNYSTSFGEANNMYVITLVDQKTTSNVDVRQEKN